MQGQKSNNQKEISKNTLFYHRVKNHAEKGVLPTFFSDDRALINNRSWLAAYINQVDVKSKTSQQKDGHWLLFREYLLSLKEGKNVIVCKSMFMSTLGLKSDGMITEMVRAKRQSYDGSIAPIEDRWDSHPSSNKCYEEVKTLQ